MQIQVDEAFSGIDVACEQRYDLLTNLFKVAKGYAKHEQETITSCIQYRKGMSVQELSQLNEQAEAEFSRINALAESYPSLKSDTVFLNLQQGVANAETSLQATRRVYNSNVSEYNQTIVSIPTNFVALIISAKQKEFFKSTEGKTQPVMLDF